MCGRSGGAEGREEAPGRGGVRLRKEEPHTKMWGKTWNMFAPRVIMEFEFGVVLKDSEDFGEIDVDLDDLHHPSVPDGYLAARCTHRSYCIMGRPSPYMVVAGRSDAVGMESINGGNVGYYNSLMDAAWSHCGSSSCVIITNPKGFRTQSRFHIHYRHQSGYGKSLKSKMEAKVCHAEGWHHGDFPCGGQAKLFSGGKRESKSKHYQCCHFMLKGKLCFVISVRTCWRDERCYGFRRHWQRRRVSVAPGMRRSWHDHPCHVPLQHRAQHCLSNMFFFRDARSAQKM